ncbi:PREDICTED: polyamine oxidase-like [Wasmannia auropunctata]|uniref:polyamine oxidase-like n=1 Tax=Wasmannia auropunctata TaxID=64793 RepID=UPI0005EEEF40|nr:PREDICTED: polyamine oxidase-like [Wasmannia auropunctata]
MKITKVQSKEKKKRWKKTFVDSTTNNRSVSLSLSSNALTSDPSLNIFYYSAMNFRFCLVASILILDVISIRSTACNTTKETKIVIVGAGAAGIAAASRLSQRGVNDFVILEANDRIGGRIYTKDFGENVVDLGAQWVHGQIGNVVFELASKHNLLSSFAVQRDFSKQEFVTINGEIMPREDNIKILTIFENILDKLNQTEFKEERKSLGDNFIREYYKIFNETFDGKPFIMNRSRADEYLSWAEKWQNSEDGSDTWFDVSAKRWTEYWDCEGDQLLGWKERGYRTIFDLLLQKIPNVEECLPVMEKIEFGKIVATINYSSGENVTVITRDGCKYSALHVIFTGSLGVLKEKHASIFVPSLSQKKQRAIEGLSIGTVNKVYLEYPHRCAGEATHDHYYSTVHGAVETGFREADRLIDFERQLNSHL